MSHSSSSTPLNNGQAPSWLQEQVYAPKRQRTMELVKKAVDALVATRQRVSLASVAAASRQVDPEGAGVSESAILGNDEARAYYQRHRTWKAARAKRPSVSTAPSAPAILRVNPDRDTVRARQRYMRLSKQDLVDRLIAVEQAYAEQEEHWLRLNDELLTWRLRAEQAERRS